MNWTEQQEHTDVQHSHNRRRTMISYMPQKMLTSEKKNLVTDKCESNVFYYI